MALTAPHGGVLISRLAERPDNLDKLEVVQLTPRELSDLDMIASGALSPLGGFMGSDDYRSVLSRMRLSDGTVWTLPVCLAVDREPQGAVVALADQSGALYGTLDVQELFGYDKQEEAQVCFGTTDKTHPGVARLYTQKPFYLAGAVSVFSRPGSQFPELSLDPLETRQLFEEHNWSRVVGFQTRNPIHRAHEYLTKVALESVDGLLIHPLVGETKDDDVPASTRVACYRALIDGYYPKDRVVLSAFPAAMRYAGPREAVWHAICRKNYGCSHFIVGRDHAGVGNFYGSYDAQLIFDRFSSIEVGIEIIRFEHSFWCRACGGIATTKSCPHAKDERLILSGTKIRELLAAGESLPQEFSRPEVAKILRQAYRDQMRGKGSRARPSNTSEVVKQVSRRPSRLLDGTTFLGNLIVGSVSGMIVGAVMGLLIAISLEGGIIRGSLIGAAAAALPIGLLCGLAGMTTQVKAVVAEQNRRLEAGEKPLSALETIDELEAPHATVHRLIRALADIAALLRPFRR